MGREVGGGIGMGKTCEPKAFSFQCMTKFTTKKKKSKTSVQNDLTCTWETLGRLSLGCCLRQLESTPEGAASWEVGNGRKELTWGKTSLSTMTVSPATNIMKTEATSPSNAPSAPKRYSGQASGLLVPSS